MGYLRTTLFIFSILFLSTTLYAQGTLPFSETGSYGMKFEVDTNARIYVNRYHPSSGASDIFHAQTNGSTRWILGVHDNLHMTFKVAGSERMRIKNNGYVGIGTTAPTYKLDVVGDIGLSQYLRHNDDSDTYIRLQSDDLQLYAGGDQILRADEDASPTLTFGSVWDASFNGSSLFVGGTQGSYNGNVGIGTSTPGNKLEVNGTIRSKELVIETVGWPDYVFNPDYTLLPLSYVEEYIDDNGHLPGVPSQEEVEQNGQVVGETQKILLQKIEELTLYVIELKKENEQVKKELEELKEQIK